MFISVLRFFHSVRSVIAGLCILIFCTMPDCAYASWEIVDVFNLAPFVPDIFAVFMGIASSGYNFFVGNGDGIIYILIWAFLAMSLSLYSVKLYMPKIWVSLFGFSGGGEMATGSATGMQLSMNVLNPCIRAIVAATILLQIKPIYLTEWLVNPFLEFGALYTESVFIATGTGNIGSSNIQCPSDILETGWVSEKSCDYLVKPVDIISRANNKVIKRGFEFIDNGLTGLITPIPHGGEDFFKLITGIILVFTFGACNLFMALLIIQAIFEFGMSLILYPFRVLTWVAKPSDKWFDVWPAFSGVVSALQKLIITMIACAFILCINIAIVKSLFKWSNVVYVAAAHGTSSSNVPQINNASGFSEHFMLCLSAILTLYLMFKIFDLTREQLKKYSGTSDTLYKTVLSNTSATWAHAKKVPEYATNVKQFTKDSADAISSVSRSAWNGMKNVGRKIKSRF